MSLSFMVLVLASGLVVNPLVFADNGKMKADSKEAAMQMAAPAATKAQTVQAAALEEVGNTICPISGEKIIPGKEVKITYNGKVYNMCCSMCEKDFKKNPEAAIKKLKAAK